MLIIMINTDNIFEIIYMDYDNIKKNVVKYIENSSKLLESLNENNKVIKFLKEDTLILNFYLNLINYKLINEEDDEIWNSLNNMLITHNNDFIINKNLYEILSNKKEKFLINFKNNMELNGINNNKIKIILKTISNNEKNINENLNINSFINLDNKLLNKQIKNDKKVKIELNFDNYYYLLNNISSSIIRKRIEVLYNKKSDNFLKDIGKISILKNIYANEMNYNSFSNLKIKNNSNNDNIKIFIDKLLLLIDEKSNLELLNIKSKLNKDGFDKKVDYNDLIYYHNKIQDKTLFKPSKVLDVIFELFEEYFFIKIENFNENIFKCKDIQNDKLLGFLILNFKIKSKKHFNPTYIKLYDNFDDKNVLCSLINCNFESLDKKCINYNDINKLFIEFGYLLKNLNETFEDLNNNDILEYDLLLPNLMSSLSYEKFVINKITNDSNITDHILFSKGVDFCINLKIKCLDILFDNILYSDINFFNSIKNELDKNSDCSKIKEFYIKFYKKFFKNNEKYFNTDIKNIPLSVIYNLINGSEGILFYNLLCEIISEKILIILKKNKKEKLKFNNILKNKELNFRDKILNYLSNYERDIINLVNGYLVKNSNIISHIKKDINIDFTDDTNFFDDINSDTDSDQDNIINIKNSTTTKKNII